MPTTTAHRDRLAQIRERTHNARQTRNRARQTLEAANKVGDADGQAVASLALEEATIAVETSEALENRLLSSMAGVNGAGQGFGGETFLDDPSTVSMLEQLAHSSAPIGSIMLGQFMDADRFAASLSPRLAASEDQPGLDGKRKQVWAPIVRQPYRPLTLLDLLATGTMTGSSIEYVIEGGDLDAMVAETAEGAVKPEGEVTFAEAEAPARTIATWIKQRRQVLADVPELQTVLSQRLIYQVNRRIEKQVLTGDGVGQNLTGLLNTSGIGSVPNDPAVPASDMVLAGMTMVSLSEATPTGVVVHPTAYETLLTTKTDGSGQRLDSGGAFVGPADSIWGIPIVLSAVMDPKIALVGDFTLACTLLIREGVNLRISDSDQDDFIRNRITLLAESRVALPVWQPSALAEVHLAA